MNDVPSPSTIRSEKPIISTLVRIRVKGLEMPPIKDGLLIGQKAAIGADAMLRTLGIMTHEPFERLGISDGVIEDVIVKSSILRKVGRERVARFVMNNLKPMMTPTELLMLDIYVEMTIEDSE